MATTTGTTTLTLHKSEQPVQAGVQEVESSIHDDPITSSRAESSGLDGLRRQLEEHLWVLRSNIPSSVVVPGSDKKLNKLLEYHKDYLEDQKYIEEKLVECFDKDDRILLFPLGDNGRPFNDYVKEIVTGGWTEDPFTTIMLPFFCGPVAALEQDFRVVQDVVNAVKGNPDLTLRKIRLALEQLPVEEWHSTLTVELKNVRNDIEQHQEIVSTLQQYRDAKLEIRDTLESFEAREARFRKFNDEIRRARPDPEALPITFDMKTLLLDHKDEHVARNLELASTMRMFLEANAAAAFNEEHVDLSKNSLLRGEKVSFPGHSIPAFVFNASLKEIASRGDILTRRFFVKNLHTDLKTIEEVLGSLSRNQE